MISSDSIMYEDALSISKLDLPWDTLAGKTILVTGVGGMLSSLITRAFLTITDIHKLNIHLLALTHNITQLRDSNAYLKKRPDCFLIESDICDLTESKIGSFDIAINGASPARPALHATNPVETLRANLIGTDNLLRCSVNRNAKFVMISSSEVYGNHTDGIDRIDEFTFGYLDPISPRSCYPEGKRAAEALVASYNRQFGLDALIARFGHIYGPGMALNDGRVQADFAADVVNHQDIALLSDGLSRRTYTYISDAVSGLLTALLCGNDLVYNIADPNGNVRIRDLAQQFVDARPRFNLHLVFANTDDKLRLFNSSPVLSLDASRLIALGWDPQITLANGIDRTLQSLGV